MNTITKCQGCHLVLPAIEGPVHAYALSSPACWKLYGEVLAREYGNKDYWQIHRLTVDAYAVQHPGNNDRRAIQSVSAHLASLHLIFNKHFSFEEATKTIGRIIKKNKENFIFLKSPDSVGDLTILDVWNAKNAKQHTITVKKWAQSVWEAWREHHQYIAELSELAMR